MTGRALVTGADGFVGSKLCVLLAERGWEVRGAAHRMAAEADQLACDVRNSDDVDQLFEWAGPVTHVFHLAAIAFVPEADRDPVRTFDINLNGTVRVTNGLRRHTPKARLVFVGTSGVYGPPRSLPVTEEHPFNPQNTYDISKAAADEFIGYLGRSAGVDAVRVRAFNHSGPGQADDFVLPSLARQVARIEAGLALPTLRVGNLDAARDFSHVDDIIRAYERIALDGRAGEAYNVCSGEPHRIREALDILLSLSRVPIRVEVDKERLRAVDVPEVAGSHDKLTVDTGWRPEISFRRMLEEILEYWRQNL